MPSHHHSHRSTTATSDLGKLLLRLVLGVLILLHGLAKLKNGVGGVSGMLAHAGLPTWLAYGAYLGEVVGPLLLIVGLFTRLGAVLVAGNMLFAFALAHMGQLAQFNAQGGWQLELQGMFLGTALAVALLGAGRYSLGGAHGTLN